MPGVKRSSIYSIRLGLAASKKAWKQIGLQIQRLEEGKCLFFSHLGTMHSRQSRPGIEATEITYLGTSASPGSLFCHPQGVATSSGSRGADKTLVITSTFHVIGFGARRRCVFSLIRRLSGGTACCCLFIAPYPKPSHMGTPQHKGGWGVWFSWWGSCTWQKGISLTKDEDETGNWEINSCRCHTWQRYSTPHAHIDAGDWFTKSSQCAIHVGSLDSTLLWTSQFLHKQCFGPVVFQ